MELFVGLLPQTAGMEDLHALFTPFRGKVAIELIERRFADGSSARFGVASFDSDRLARQAIRQLDGSAVAGARLRVRGYSTRGRGATADGPRPRDRRRPPLTRRRP